MNLRIVSLLVCTVFLSSCLNIFGFVDKPKGDEQLLSAARACLDRGDYVCAREHYQALSSNYNDIKISETVLTTLAENQVFSMEDLISSLGSSRGGGDSFARMAEYIAARGKATRASRLLITESYQQAASIASAPLRAYVEFVTSLAMFGTVLGVAVGSDQRLGVLDLVASTSCRTDGGCIGNANCAVGTGTGLSSSTTTVSDMSITADWDTVSANLGQLLGSANTAQNKLGSLTNSADSGLFETIIILGSLSGTAPCIRKELLSILFP